MEARDMQTFYKSFIRPSLEYAAPAWATSLPETWTIYRKRAMKIIFQNQPYTEALESAKLEPVNEIMLQFSKTFFTKIQNPEYRLHDILPTTREYPHTLRNSRKLPIPSLRTSRCQKSLIPCALKNFQ